MMKKLLLSLLTGLFVTLVSHAQNPVHASGDDNTKEEIVFQEVEQMPAFPGGMTALSKYLARTVRYPGEAVEAKVQGMVIVDFVVNQTGGLTQVKVLKGIGYGCDEEAIRVVQLMPAWTPGQQDGRPVSVRFTIPIRFAL